MWEGPTLDMQKYREEDDWLEYKQMMNDPSTAYLVDGAEFDCQIDELGVTEIGPETIIELSTIQRCKQGLWLEVSAVQ